MVWYKLVRHAANPFKPNIGMVDFENFCLYRFCGTFTSDNTVGPLLLSRDAKGQTNSGNFGNFQWKVSGILKGWEFWEFSIYTYFQHFMRLYVQKSTELNLLWTNSKALVLHNVLALWWFLWIFRKNHKALLWVRIRPNLLSFYWIIFFHIIFGFQQKR